jgi:hypothetical protein
VEVKFFVKFYRPVVKLPFFLEVFNDPLAAAAARARSFCSIVVSIA